MSNDTHTLSGAYALDALGPEEAAEFRRHLEVCQVCCEEVRELRAAAAQMGEAEAMIPPPALKARVLAGIERTPQEPPRVQPVVSAPVQGDVVPIQRGASRRHWLPRLVAAAAAVLVVGGGAIALSNQESPTAPPQLSAAAAEVFNAEDARILTVRTKNGGRLTVGVSAGRNEMAVDTRKLPSLDDAHVYQLWAVHNGDMVSAGVVTALDKGAAMEMPGAETKVAITIEPAGGSERPTTEPVVIVDPAQV